jgi:hypothetical protein
VSFSIRSEMSPGGVGPVYTAHVRCTHGIHGQPDECHAEETYTTGGPEGALDAAEALRTKADDLGWELSPSPRCPAHRTTLRPAKVLLLGTMDTPWRAEVSRVLTSTLTVATVAGASTVVRVLSNEDPRWLDARDPNPVQALLGNDLVLIQRADVVLWHHGLQGETARIEFGLLAGLFPVPRRVVVHVEDGVSWRPYAEALCGLRRPAGWAATAAGPA